MNRVVVLRPEPGAGATAAAARAAGLAAVVVPLFAIQPCDWDPPGPLAFDAVMMTSANAARFGGPALAAYRALPLHAVGAATAAAARAAGFTEVIETGPNAGGLIARLIADGHRHVLDLGGRDRSPVDPGPLHVERRTVYASEEIVVDGSRLAAAAADGAVMLLHSRRAGDRLATLIDPAGASIAAISLAAAGDHPWGKAAVSAAPNDAALLAAAARLCDQHAQTSGGPTR
jgi:uroporphyrinogen-III synthase